MKFYYKKSFWVMFSVYMSLWLAAVLIGGTILEGYKDTINHSLGLSGVRTEAVSNEEEDLEYFKSDYVQKDADGNVLYTTDENGYKHQLYDDVALWEENVKKAKQVIYEGTTILWNSDTNGLPLAKGNKVSLFSHSSVDWAYSGVGSGSIRTNGISNMQGALTSAGLSVNPTLWNFYKSGAGSGSNYTRTEKMYVREVPWSKYTDAVKNSFAQYGDAAIITISRLLGEGSGQSGVKDATSSSADTVSGDYFDLSAQEKRMIEEVINAKNAGTFKKIIVLLNTPTGMWFDPIFDFKTNIDCCMWVGQGGYMALEGLADILVGDAIPSGHLADTFVYNTQSEASFVNLTARQYDNARNTNLDLYQQGAYTVYVENIYVGYKYYETRYEDTVLKQGNATSTAGAVNSTGNWNYSQEVAFPFGYGGSYTTFVYSNYQVEKQENGDYKVTVTVKNTGTKNGADAVQVYIQKPYTEYDRQYKIEQASVNLVGYAKTKELAPNQTETVEIIVRDDAFKTYDANNKKTYIREKGDYYLAVGQDAHDALNNILAAKGKTTADGMDYNGNSAFVKKYNFPTDDFTTYSVSEYTDNAITNQFDDTDWNKYENKTDGTVTYLSRNDWQSTYPTARPEFSLNDAMIADLGYNKPVQAKPGDKMPLYGQTHVYNLIDLRGLDYNHAAWDTLLNQLNFEDYTALFSAYNGTGVIAHIVKPGEAAEDGPLGIRTKYKTNFNHYAMGFPSTTLLAATYNDELALEIGVLMGEDMLHTGSTGIYAPGANLHRSTYGGRSFEYYSEDGFLTGIMAKWQVIGIQSKGCNVQMKHFALNDQESNRHGGAIWANEQSIREVYLPAFEYSVTEGNLTGLMSSFSRFGTIWSGAHKGLTTNVLRGEWNFMGFVISDAAWRVYMGPVDGIMAGNDAILTDNTAIIPLYDVAKTNATVALAMRESAHRVLYVIANGNAMNGFSSNTKIYEVREWWQHLVAGIQIGIGTLTGAVVIIAILSFIFQDKLKAKAEAQRVARKQQREQDNVLKSQTGEEQQSGGFGVKVKNFFCIGKPWNARRILTTVISAVLVVAIVFTSIYVPIALSNNDNGDVPPVHEGNGGGNNGGGGNGGGEETTTLKDQLTATLGTLTDYRFEAECSEIETDIARMAAGLEGTLAANNYPSGGMFVHHMTDAGNAKLTFNVTSAEDTQAVLSICMGQAGVERWPSEFFGITVNGASVTIDPTVSFKIASANSYYDWSTQQLAIINLTAGENVIVITKLAKPLNFDYVELSSPKALQWTSEVNNGGHTYGTWEVINEPTLDTEGEAGAYCTTCRHYQYEVLPVISEANGYVKTVTSPNSDTTFGSATWKYTKGDNTFTFGSRLYPNQAQTYKFEAERMVATGEATIGQEIQANASGGAYVGHTHKREWSLTLRITSDKACEALLIMNVSPRNNANVSLNDGRTLTVNGTALTIPSDVIFYAVDSDNSYFNWDEFEIMVISLQAGVNTITLSNASKSFVNIDYYKIVSSANLEWYYEE